jgi:hypothetical protein
VHLSQIYFKKIQNKRSKNHGRELVLTAHLNALQRPFDQSLRAPLQGLYNVFFFYKLWLQHESCTYIYINQKETKQKKGGPNQNPSRKSKQGESISIMIIRLDSFTGQMTMPNETIQRQA